MKLNKDFEFSLKVMVLIILIAFLAFDFVLQVYSPKKNLEGIPAIERINIYYAFFTTQSNYAVVLYLVVALLMRRIYNTKPAFGIEMAMTVYITVTMLVFWFGLLASPDELGAYYPANWVSTIVLHMFIPSIMIGYFMLSCGDNYYSIRKYSKFSLPLTCSYPIGYLIFVMIRGEIRFKYFSPEFFYKIYSTEADGAILESTKWFWDNQWTEGAGVINQSQYFTQQMWYPYWFLNIHQFELKFSVGSTMMPPVSKSIGPEWLVISIFILAILAITFLVVNLQFMYLNWNNGKFYRWHDIEGKIISKEEHDYRKKKAKLERYTAIKKAKMKLLHDKTNYKVFLKSIKSLDKKIRNEKRKEYIKTKILEEKLQRAQIKQQKVINKSHKDQIKRFILSLNYKDRPFVKENLREAERYKKLVNRGVLISKPKYVD
ncbi:Pr6Pr family membrane protein [Spiroplasma monobiae]|uniref:Transmembrane protein n=1 Tax=Spiroplasma monobiae MQ-1 TaxID=1336748 RepID=A0A2K9LVA0_SPISQ|nr:Pr6Pr family membrane protein [Spiroplasma monobiae]AUM62957.1 hypothetical protein SMONO_v1c07080 [Spiroplasma monobiae MQ-1]